MKNKLIIVAGCSGSGKTTVAKTILENFEAGEAQILCIDRYYLKDKSHMPRTSSGKINYDHPDAFDWTLLRKDIKSLLSNKPTVCPVYDYQIQQRSKKGDLIKPSKYIILEGIMPLYDRQLNSLAELKIFVDTPLDECFIRRLMRDQEERGRSINSIAKQWQDAVRPMYLDYVEPTKRYADIILPWEKINMTGLDVLTNAIKNLWKD